MSFVTLSEDVMKKMYVWENVSELTNNYHDGGGVMVIADSMEAARELLIKNGVPKGCGAMKEQPDYSASVGSDEDKVFIFQDAGCC